MLDARLWRGNLEWLAWDTANTVLFFVREGRLYVWDNNTDAGPQELSNLAPRVNGIRMSPDGGTLASAASDGTITLWDVLTRVNRATLKGYRARPDSFGVEFSSDGSRLAISGPGKEISLWDVATGRHLSTLHGDMLQFAPTGDQIALAINRPKALLYDAGTGNLEGSLDGDRLVFSPDSGLVAGVTYSEEVVIWELMGRRRKKTLPVHGDCVKGLTFSPDNKLLMTLDGDDVVQLWNVSSGAMRCRLELPYSQIEAHAFSPDSALLALGGWPEEYHMLVGPTSSSWTLPPGSDGQR